MTIFQNSSDQKSKIWRPKVQTLSAELRNCDEKHEREMAVLRRDSDHKIRELNQVISNEKEKFECQIVERLTRRVPNPHLARA